MNKKRFLFIPELAVLFTLVSCSHASFTQRRYMRGHYHAHAGGPAGPATHQREAAVIETAVNRAEQETVAAVAKHHNQPDSIQCADTIYAGQGTIICRVRRINDKGVFFDRCGSGDSKGTIELGQVRQIVYHNGIREVSDELDNEYTEPAVVNQSDVYYVNGMPMTRNAEKRMNRQNRVRNGVTIAGIIAAGLIGLDLLASAPVLGLLLLLLAIGGVVDLSVNGEKSLTVGWILYGLGWGAIGVGALSVLFLVIGLFIAILFFAA